MKGSNSRKIWTVLREHDQLVFLVTGLLFLSAAALLAVREVNLGLGYALAGATLIAAMVSHLSRMPALRMGGQVLATAGGALAISMYVAQLEFLVDAYLLAPLVLLGATLAWVIRLKRVSTGEFAPRQMLWFTRVVWLTLTLALIAVSWSFYYQFITSGLSPDFHLRRLILTGFWVLCGLAFYLGGRIRKLGPMLACGLIMLVMASFKALVYDTTHLHGFDRILVLSVMGAVLTGAAMFLRRRTRPDPKDPAREVSS